MLDYYMYAPHLAPSPGNGGKAGMGAIVNSPEHVDYLQIKENSWVIHAWRTLERLPHPSLPPLSWGRAQRGGMGRFEAI